MALNPEKRLFLVQNLPMTEAAIGQGVLRDLYIAMAQLVGGNARTLRIQIKPFVPWIWGGCLMMAFCGLLAGTDRLYRLGAVGRARDGARPRENIQPALLAAALAADTIRSDSGPVSEAER